MYSPDVVDVRQPSICDVSLNRRVRLIGSPMPFLSIAVHGSSTPIAHRVIPMPNHLARGGVVLVIGRMRAPKRRLVR
ncbi:hypothetical protein B0H19DRAFT_1146049 [Mycena capillaripes]|nr:hypothetical protein B0H19DRAFT_1146049 [Mycena capillaripes]